MKWFKHYSDSYSNLKLQQVLSEHGTEGYGFFWICVEFVAQQGTNSRIKIEKNWKRVLAHIGHVSEERMNHLLNFFASVNLIDKRGLEIGDLYIPKLKDYGDEYSDKLRRKSRQGRDNVGLDKTRTEEIRPDKNRNEEQFQIFYKEYPNKKGKGQAIRAWNKLKITEELFEEIMSGLKKLKLSKGWIAERGKYIPHPSTFLNGQRWLDQEVELSEPKHSRQI
ncbi:MAG TPA: Lin1244/Lin1753 domain-containing protein [Candidatus Paceibacterota bacterium]